MKSINPKKEKKPTIIIISQFNWNRSTTHNSIETNLREKEEKYQNLTMDSRIFDSANVFDSVNDFEVLSYNLDATEGRIGGGEMVRSLGELGLRINGRYDGVKNRRRRDVRVWVVSKETAVAIAVVGETGACALLQFSDLGVSCNGETGAKPIPNRFTRF